MMLASLFMNGLGRYFSAKYGMIMGAYSRLAEVPAALVTEMPYSEALDTLALAGTRAAAIAAVVIILLAMIAASYAKSIGTSLKETRDTEYDIEPEKGVPLKAE
jgi:hypothetical protein